MPQLSIITINLNNANGLRQTIKSVVEQTYQDFEFLVIDGGSADDSLSVIQEYSDRINFWTSESDRGIYDAMNKGIRRATGRYLLFLNSGDNLADNSVVSRVWPEFNADFDLLYGHSLMVGRESFERVPSVSMRFSEFVMRQGPHHQSTFIKRSLFGEIGLYNEKNKILADWEFFLKAIFKYEKKIKYLPFVVSCFDLNGVSSDVRNRNMLLEEKERIIQENYPRFADDYKELSVLKKLIKKSRVIRLYMKYIKRVNL